MFINFKLSFYNFIIIIIINYYYKLLLLIIIINYYYYYYIYYLKKFFLCKIYQILYRRYNKIIYIHRYTSKKKKKKYMLNYKPHIDYFFYNFFIILYVYNYNHYICNKYN